MKDRIAIHFNDPKYSENVVYKDLEFKQIYYFSCKRVNMKNKVRI